VTLPIDFLSEAESEIEDAYHWYETQSPGLGIRFVFAIEAALRRASENPLSYPAVLRRTRKALVHRFPYHVFYVVDEDRIPVTGVFHGHRHPESWTDRIREAVASDDFCPEAVGRHNRPVQPTSFAGG